MKAPHYTTSELARLVGVSKNTLFRWESEGLVRPSLRDGRGWRVWSKQDLERVIEVKKGKELVTSGKSTGAKKLNINIIGYGNQAKAWAGNLKNSGANVRVLLREGSKSARVASNDGFEVLSIKKGLVNASGNIFCLLIPDEDHANFFEEYEGLIKSEYIFVFGHGFSMGYQGLNTKAKKILLAPKAIAKLVRSKYLDGNTVPAVYSAGNVELKKTTLELAKLVGFFPLVEASFYEETVSDLFSEQAVLCSIVPYIIYKSTEFLKSKGIPEEIAVYECLHELGFIIDVIKQKGLGGMYESISPVAMAGGLGVLNEFKNNFDIDKYMNNIFKKIENKEFLKNLKTADRKKLVETIRHDSKSFDKSVAKVNI